MLLVFLPYQIPYLSSTGPLACFLVLLADYGQPASPPLFSSSAAELRNILCLVVVGFFAISNPLSLEYGPSRVFFGPTTYLLLATTTDYGQPAPYSIIPQSCGILCCWLVFLPYQTPYLASTGPLACRDLLICRRQNSAAAAKWWPLASCFGPTHGPPALFNNSAELRNLPRRPAIIKSLSR